MKQPGRRKGWPRMKQLVTHYVRWDLPPARVMRALCGAPVHCDEVTVVHAIDPSCATCRGLILDHEHLSVD